MTGTYIGEGKTALLQHSTPGLVEAQFDEGPLWMTNSWIRFEEKDDGT